MRLYTFFKFSALLFTVCFSIINATASSVKAQQSPVKIKILQENDSQKNYLSIKEDLQFLPLQDIEKSLNQEQNVILASPNQFNPILRTLDLVSTLKQRLRWAQGTIQVLLQENPLTKSGLSFWQRLQYFQTMYSYFSGFFTLIFICCPIIFFFTDIIPVSAYGPDFAIHFFPAFVINRLTFISATWGIPAGELWRSEQYAIALFPLFIQSVWSVFSGTPLSFQVTPKQRQSGNYLYLVFWGCDLDLIRRL